MAKQAKPITAERIHSVCRRMGFVTNSQASDIADAVMSMLYGNETDDQIVNRIWEENNPSEDDE